MSARFAPVDCASSIDVDSALADRLDSTLDSADGAVDPLFAVVDAEPSRSVVMMSAAVCSGSVSALPFFRPLLLEAVDDEDAPGVTLPLFSFPFE